MPCTITPYNLLTAPKQTGGKWTLASGGPANLSINGAPYDIYADGVQLGTTDLVTVGFDNTQPGILVLRYSVGDAPCTDTADLTVDVVAGAKAGIDVNVTYCTVNNTPINLFDLLKGGNGSGNGTGNVDTSGVWSGSGTTGNPGYNPNGPSTTDDTFTPNLITDFPNGDDREFQFIYTVTRPNSFAGCANCTDTATINIKVTLQPNAGGNFAIVVCNAL